jgi:hypothetical protein
LDPIRDPRTANASRIPNAAGSAGWDAAAQPILSHVRAVTVSGVLAVSGRIHVCAWGMGAAQFTCGTRESVRLPQMRRRGSNTESTKTEDVWRKGQVNTVGSRRPGPELFAFATTYPKGHFGLFF